MKDENTNFNRVRRGCLFKDNKFYSLTKDSLLILTGWPNPHARARGLKGRQDGNIWADNCLRGFSHAYGASLPQEEENMRFLSTGQGVCPDIFFGDDHTHILTSFPKAMREYVNQMPEAVWNELLKYRTGRWPILRLMASCPGAIDLSRSNPAILFALANHPHFHSSRKEQAAETINSLIYQKQRNILQWLRFTPTEANRRILARIAPNLLTITILQAMRLVLRKPELAGYLRLSQTTELTASVLEMLSDIPAHCHLTPQLLQDCARYDRETRSAPWYTRPPQLIQRIRTLSRYLGYEPAWKKRFTSLAMLRALHEQFISEFDAIYPDGCDGRDSSTPFAGNSHIIPLMTREDLEKEGREQCNCVKTYSKHVKERTYCIYRVEQPVRATLSIRRDSMYSAWVPDKVLQARNKPVDDEIRCRLFAELFKTGKLGRPSRRTAIRTKSRKQALPTLWDWAVERDSAERQNEQPTEEQGDRICPTPCDRVGSKAINE